MSNSRFNNNSLQPYSSYILGVKVDFGYTLPSVLLYIKNVLKTNTFGNYICTTNPEFIVESQTNSAFKEIINKSMLSVPDGIGIIYAEAFRQYVSSCRSKICTIFYSVSFCLKTLFIHHKVAARITGIDLFEHICHMSHDGMCNIFLLGGKVRNFRGDFVHTNLDVASVCAEKMRQRFPNINIVGSTSSFSFKEPDDVETISYIHDCMSKKGIESIDVLFVAYGQYNQESWIVRNASKLPAKMCIGVGRTFDYFGGFETPTPQVFINLHLEWLFRLITQPWRLTRTLKAFPLFPFLILKQTLVQDSCVDTH